MTVRSEVSSLSRVHTQPRRLMKFLRLRDKSDGVMVVAKDYVVEMPNRIKHSMGPS